MFGRHPLQRLAPGSGRCHIVLRPAQDLGQGLANFRLVVDDEYPARGRARLAGGSRIDDTCVQGAHRQRDGEYRSPHLGAIERQPAAVGLDDAVAHGQSHPGAQSGGLGGEIRLEHARAKPLRNARTVVGDRDADHAGVRVVTTRHAYPARPRPVLQHLLRVDDQVQQDLMKLVRVGEDPRNVLGEIDGHFDAAGAHRVAGNVEGRRHDVVDRHRNAFGCLLPRHGEEGSHDPRAALRRRANLRCCSLRGRVALFLEHDRPGHDHGKRVVELVGDAGQERAERGQFFALIGRFALAGQLLRRALFLRDVASDGQHVRLALILHRDPVHLELQCGAVLAQLRQLRATGFAGGDRPKEPGIV